MQNVPKHPVQSQIRQFPMEQTDQGLVCVQIYPEFKEKTIEKNQ